MHSFQVNICLEQCVTFKSTVGVGISNKCRRQQVDQSPLRIQTVTEKYDRGEKFGVRLAGLAA